MTTRKIAGLMVMVGAAIYARIETSHFGNNWLPQSDAEVIADGLALVTCAIGVAMFWGGSGRARSNDRSSATGSGSAAHPKQAV